ncbi:winged helix-turn-helix domain-containing protein [Haloferax profundi]|uniref:ArsR family transcriptional regulator n=1 Tax=Haloferax profundi TaxID=1544718 RepID=A0A0W1SRI3_9EURY|nr:winged helix-turn-helix domain-containing protein [Haloferax profundi]KTG28444.1 ArsR family transcriptional regulator [Haloferax profundi]
MSDSASIREDSVLDCDDCLSPAEAFAIVADETRLTILEALWESPDRPVPFSELRRRVGVDDSARFNYHLGKLRGQFVHKTDEGYDFRHAGEKVVRAVLAGTFNEDPVLPAFPAPGTCVSCDGPLEADYGDEKLTIACADCERVHAHEEFPPGGLQNRSTDALLSAFDQRVRHLHCLAADGVCPECGGTTSTELSRDTDPFELDVVVNHRCAQCAYEAVSPVGLVLLDESTVLGFLSSRGDDVCGTPFWRFSWVVGDDALTIVDDDPWRISVRIEHESDALVVELDETLACIDSRVEHLGEIA